MCLPNHCCSFVIGFVNGNIKDCRYCKCSHCSWLYPVVQKFVHLFCGGGLDNVAVHPPGSNPKGGSRVYVSTNCVLGGNILRVVSMRVTVMMFCMKSVRCSQGLWLCREQNVMGSSFVSAGIGWCGLHDGGFGELWWRQFICSTYCIWWCVIVVQLSFACSYPACLVLFSKIWCYLPICCISSILHYLPCSIFPPVIALSIATSLVVLSPLVTQL